MNMKRRMIMIMMKMMMKKKNMNVMKYMMNFRNKYLTNIFYH